MTRILTWNIQYGWGADAALDLDRIATTIRAFAGEPDIICLQELARHFPELDEGIGADQAAFFNARFFEYDSYFGAALDRAGPSRSRRRQFGNMILSRLPMLEVRSFPLPQPAHPGVKHMRRIALEAVIVTAAGPLRVTTTHLEFHSEAQRLAQVEALRAFHQEACANTVAPPAAASEGTYVIVPRPPEAVVCGDFNFEVDAPEYRRMTAPFADGTPPLLDAWRARHGDRPHAPTCGIFDRDQWPQGGHARDFCFVSAPLALRVKDVVVDTKTNASDHQPVLLVLE